MTRNRTATVVSRGRHHPRGGRQGASARARTTCSCTARTPSASGVRRSTIDAVGRPHRPDGRRRHRRPEPEQRRAHRQGQPRLPRRLGADHRQGRRRRRRRTSSPTPRASSTPRWRPPPAAPASSSSPSTASSTPPTETVYGLIPISQVKALSDGTHHVFVRGQDAAGNWGALFGVDLVVDKKAPVLGAADRHAQPHERGGDADPHGAGRRDVLRGRRVLARQHRPRCREGHPGAGQPGQQRSIVATVPLAGIAVGTQQVNLRVQDLAGNWSNAVHTSVTVEAAERDLLRHVRLRRPDGVVRPDRWCLGDGGGGHSRRRRQPRPPGHPPRWRGATARATSRTPRRTARRATTRRSASTRTR